MFDKDHLDMTIFQNIQKSHSQRSFNEAAEQLVDYIIKANTYCQDRVYQCFLPALKETQQNDLHQLLTEQGTSHRIEICSLFIFLSRSTAKL